MRPVSSIFQISFWENPSTSFDNLSFSSSITSLSAWAASLCFQKDWSWWQSLKRVSHPWLKLSHFLDGIFSMLANSCHLAWITSPLIVRLLWSACVIHWSSISSICGNLETLTRLKWEAAVSSWSWIQSSSETQDEISGCLKQISG